jgi:uncharacterized Zn finger protein (UPF0148 family)
MLQGYLVIYEGDSCPVCDVVYELKELAEESEKVKDRLQNTLDSIQEIEKLKQEEAG